MLPPEVREAVAARIGSVKSFAAVSGGCINHGGQLTTAQGNFFVKWNDAKRFPGMFNAEARGLDMLGHANCIRVPLVILCDQDESYQFIAMEWIAQARASSDYWETLGHNLAILHRHSAKHFGLDHGNFIGSLRQQNNYTESWVDFFINERIEPQLDFLNALPRLRSRFESLYKKLRDIFPEEQPALLHGDLWSGNLIRDENGKPCVIDPAVYFGHREMELAFTQLFGGFDERFYDTYKEVFPLAEGFEDRVDVYNLYPLLVHANLFGGHYLQEIEDILRRRA